MKKIKFQLTTVLVVLAVFISTSYIYGQVTIGVGEEPVAGALLQLKDIPNITGGFANSTKGMILPRVNLTNLDKLYPMFPAVYDAMENDKHIGLTVYNIHEDACAGIPKGVFVWDGSQWQVLGASGGGGTVLGAGVEYMTDTRDGEKYLTGDFGAAGRWFLENLRFLPPLVSGIVLSTGSDVNTTKSYYYPNGTGSTPPSTWQRQQGLLYSFSAATGGRWDGDNAYRGQMSNNPVPGPDEVESVLESSPGAKDGKLQGICPAGWHVPSDREWNDLEKVIYAHPEYYSLYPDNSSFPPADWDNWIYVWAARPPDGTPDAHGKAMKSQCSVPGGQVPDGMSLPANQGGFSILLVGLIEVTGSSNIILKYGEDACFFTSSPVYNGFRYRNMDYLTANIYDNVHSKPDLFSVRCKKDN